MVCDRWQSDYLACLFGCRSTICVVAALMGFCHGSEYSSSYIVRVLLYYGGNFVVVAICVDSWELACRVSTLTTAWFRVISTCTSLWWRYCWTVSSANWWKGRQCPILYSRRTSSKLHFQPTSSIDIDVLAAVHWQLATLYANRITIQQSQRRSRLSLTSVRHRSRWLVCTVVAPVCLLLLSVWKLIAYTDLFATYTL